MKSFFDTSVLIASFQRTHTHYAASQPLVGSALRDHSGACGIHTLAEFYAVTTRLPGAMRVDPAAAWLFLEDLKSHFSVIALTTDEYIESLRLAAETRIPGGQLYDFLLLACARKSAAEKIFTWNLKHFHALAPDLADRIVTP